MAAIQPSPGWVWKRRVLSRRPAILQLHKIAELPCAAGSQTCALLRPSAAGSTKRIGPDPAVDINEMDPKNSVESFIQFARQDLEIQSRLADCSMELWGSEHLPLDVDLAKVLAVANEYGFSLSEQDIIQSQCRKLAEFWQFEMGNAFVARRTLSHVQYQLTGSSVDIDYYEY